MTYKQNDTRQFYQKLMNYLHSQRSKTKFKGNLRKKIRIQRLGENLNNLGYIVSYSEEE